MEQTGYFRRVFVLPIGSYEYHGKELPPDTDIIIANQVANEVAKYFMKFFKEHVVLLPSINYGNAIEHSDRPFTVVITHNVYYNFIFDLVSSLTKPHDFIVFINGHGGNINTLDAVASDFNCSYQDRKIFFPHLFSTPIENYCIKLVGGMDAHAGTIEASLIAYYLGKETRKYDVKLLNDVHGSLRFFRSVEFAPEGVISNNSSILADPLIGKSIHEAIVQEAINSITTAMNRMNTVFNKKKY